MAHSRWWLSSNSSAFTVVALLQQRRISAHLTTFPRRLLNSKVVGDRKRAVFGGLVEAPVKPSNKRKYQGTNNTFVFTNTSGRPVIYHPTDRQLSSLGNLKYIITRHFVREIKRIGRNKLFPTLVVLKLWLGEGMIWKETRKTIGRGPMWNMTHKKKDGTFVNDEAEKIGNEIDKHLSLRKDNYSEISPNDVVGVVFGKEHPGSVRGLGMGVVPTKAFKHTTTHLGAMNLGSSSANTSFPDLRQKVVTMESHTSIVCLHCYEGRRKAP